MVPHTRIEKIVIWGASGHAMVVANIINLMGEYEIFGFIDDQNPERRDTNFLGYKILGGAEQLDRLMEKDIKKLIFGFGDNSARLSLAGLVKSMGFQLISAIHPKSIIAKDVHIAAGTVVAAGAVINSGSQIGENVIINTSSSVDHECIIEDGVHISPGAHLGGQVIVGRGSWIGIGACVIDHVLIGSNSLIGAGSVVVENIPDNVVAYGNPAKVKKTR